MKRKLFFLILCAFIATACSKTESGSSGPESTGRDYAGFPSLPTNSSEKVLLEGAMVAWLFEGDSGCFGTLKNGSQEVEVWADANSCEKRQYKENEPAAIVVTYRSDEQWAEKSYSIVEFREHK